MIIFIAGMPRAGSMWTYNVTRAIIAAGGKDVRPNEVPTNEKPLIHEALQSPVEDNVVYCIKTHAMLPNILPTRHPVKIICNYRDVRDAMLSFMRFTHVGFEQALQAALGMMQATDYYCANFSHNLLKIRYEQVAKTPENCISEIAGFLGIELTQSTALKIADQFSRDNVNKLIDTLGKVRTTKTGKIKGARYEKQFTTTKNPDGTLRIFDKRTSFQTNHITSNHDREWESVFSDAEKERLAKATTNWLKEYGFEP